MGILMFYNRQ